MNMSAMNVSAPIPDSRCERASRAIRARRFDEAERLLREVLAASSQRADALHLLGLLRRAQDRTTEAIELLRRAANAAPQVADYRNNLGSLLGQTGCSEEALLELDAALALQPDYADAHLNRGLALRALGRLADAEAALRRAVELRPEHAATQTQLGLLLLKMRRPVEAEPIFAALVKAHPRSADAWRGLGEALRDLHRPAEAIAPFRRYVELQPASSEGHCSLGNALFDSARIDEALVSHRKAVELALDSVDAHWNYALSLLADGQWRRGWVEYEWRKRLPQDAKQQRPFPQPDWAGQSLDGLTLLVTCEQGLGDTLQFIRYVPLLSERGAHVVVECQPRLRELLEPSLAGVARVVARGEPPPPFDLHVRLLSLPGILGTGVESIPSTIPYLQADPRRVEEWRSRLSAYPARLRVGIAWQGSRDYRNDALRSMPLRYFASLADLEGIRLFSLQKGSPGEDESAPKLRIVELDPPLDEGTGAFLDTAAVMRCLDLVITSDTSVAHLAGALGVPVWVALPHAADWRWLRRREDSPWYPTMRLFRQVAPGDWAEIFQRLADALLDHAARTEASSPNRPPPIVPISYGELLDKITILEIKEARLTDPAKLRLIRQELMSLRPIARQSCSGSEVVPLLDELRRVNAALWQIEDDVRAAEAAGEFGERFVTLARQVYLTNDRRARIKSQLNSLLGSQLAEVKQYGPPHETVRRRVS